MSGGWGAVDRKRNYQQIWNLNLFQKGPVDVRVKKKVFVEKFTFNYETIPLRIDQEGSKQNIALFLK